MVVFYCCHRCSCCQCCRFVKKAWAWYCRCRRCCCCFCCYYRGCYCCCCFCLCPCCFPCGFCSFVCLFFKSLINLLQITLQRLAAQVCGLFVDVEEKNFERRIATVLPIVASVIAPDQFEPVILTC